MREILELRINYDYAHLLFGADEGKDVGQLSKSIKIVELSKDDPRYSQIPIVSKQVKEKYDEGFFFGWQIKRKYSKKEIDTAILFQMKIKSTFEPAGEDCGTVYDETVACRICGANRKQIGSLKLEKDSIPKKDIARTIAGEIVVSEKFATAFRQRGLKGIALEHVLFGNVTSNYYQLTAINELSLSRNTLAGGNPWDFSESSEGVEFTVSGGHNIKFEKEVYKCSKGHLIGLNLLSEAYVLNSSSIGKYDFFSSIQKVGVKRGLLNPEPIYLCSPEFREMVIEEGLMGFEFDVANVE